MSTKALKDVLERVMENPVAATDPLVLKAQAELEAIEKAAKDVATTLDRPFSVSYADWTKTCKLMRSIASEAK